MDIHDFLARQDEEIKMAEDAIRKHLEDAKRYGFTGVGREIIRAEAEIHVRKAAGELVHRSVASGDDITQVLSRELARAARRLGEGSTDPLRVINQQCRVLGTNCVLLASERVA